MERIVDISHEENNNVQRLFYKYNAYLNIIKFLSNSEISNVALYNAKWDEATEIWTALEKAKNAIEMKYKPEGNWDRYEIDFDNSQVVFTKDEDT